MYCRSALIRQTRNWANIGLITVNLYAFAHVVLYIWLREYLDTPKSQTQLRDSDFGYHVIQPLEARIWGIHDMHNTLWFREHRVWFRCA